MMGSISQRINELVDKFSGGNVSKFAGKVESSEANVRNYINGTQPKAEFLSKLIEVFEISSEWLLTGSGEMMKKHNSSSFDTNNETQSDIDYIKMKLQLTEELIKGKDKLIEFLEEKIKELETRK